MDTPDTALLILAAGEASRMGEAKQLLPWKGTTLLGHVLQEARASTANKVYVVLGAHAHRIRSQIQFQEEIIMNPEWKKGMGSSIVSGMRHIMQEPPFFSSVLIALADQPLLGHAHFDFLMEGFNTSPYDVVATEYRDGIGVPAIFGRRYFEGLASLEPSQGAKKIVEAAGKTVRSVLPKGDIVDLDTKTEYQDLYTKWGQE
ncbi:MAG: NTP transferase domain-containing protein [Flavobacteriaceae bacterium]